MSDLSLSTLKNLIGSNNVDNAADPPVLAHPAEGKFHVICYDEKLAGKMGETSLTRIIHKTAVKSYK